MVVIGASRNGHNLNATLNLLRMARGLSRLFHNQTHQWIPKRTIRLVSWGGSDVNNMGMVEFLEVSRQIFLFSLECM